MEEIDDSPNIENSSSPRTASWFKSEAAMRAADLLAGAIAIALVALVHLDETFGRDLDYLEH